MISRLRLILFLVLLGSNCDLFSQMIMDSAYYEEEIRKLSRTAYDYLDKAMYDSAEYYYEKTINQQELHFGLYSTDVIASYINLAIIQRTTHNSQKAIEYLNIAEERLLGTDPNSSYLPFIYNNKGNIYLDQFDYAEANRYYEYSVRILERLGDTTDHFYALAFFNYARSEMILNKYGDNAEIKEKIKDLEKNKKEYDTRTLVNMASSFRLLENYNKANEILNLALEKVLDEPEKNFHLESSIIYAKAQNCISQGEYDQALMLLKWIVNESSSNNISINRLLYTHYRIGETYFLKGEYMNAYYWTKKTIEDNKKHLKSLIIPSSVRSEMASSFEFILLYKNLASSAKELYYETGKLDYLKEALSTYEIVIQNLKSSQVNMKNEESVFVLSDSKIEIMYEALSTALELYKIKKEEHYLEQAFSFNETFKASALNTEISKIKAMRFADFPEEVKYLEDSLSKWINIYQQQIFDEQTKAPIDSIKVDHLRSKLFSVKDDYNDLLDQLEIQFPNYFQLKYNPKSIRLEEVRRRLDYDQALAEYVLADSVLTIFVVDHSQKRVITRKVGTGFAEDCIEYYRLLQSQEFDRNVHDTYASIVRLSRKFYRTLVEPVIEITDKKEIIFIPDGELMYLPFETFLTGDVDATNVNYLDLPYLIYDLSVGYAYSATLLFNERIRKEAPRDEVLAFAPAYENLLNQDEPLVWNRQSNPDFLVPLEGAREEVSNLAGLLPARVFMDYAATEKNFKEHAEDYPVLHLAMHTIMNDEEPMFSRLAFTRVENDSVEDHDLFTYEIYNLNLNAEMVVLSSCSSGYGELQRGEGMMSMARGFMYAGCPSIVMTLWQVSDRSSAELMSSYYRYLKKGKSKYEALRLAKLDYIRSSDKLKANPYFWSSFLVVGDSAPLYGKKPVFYLALIIAGFALVLFFVVFRRQLKRRFR